MQVLLKVTLAELKNGGLREAAVSKAIDHPCLVKILTHALVADGPETEGGPSTGPGSAWLVMDFCNRGTLVVRLALFYSLEMYFFVAQLWH